MTKVVSVFANREVDLESMMSEIGEGWKPIVRDLVDDLYTAGWHGHVAQIKEKFGGLRFYADGIPPEFEYLVTDAEKTCARTCEECGAPGVLRSGGWLKTLCDSCAES